MGRRDDIVTAQDRYSRSVLSSNLRVGDGSKPEDVDALIAAGWIKAGLATMVYRALLDYDASSGERRAALARHRALAAAASIEHKRDAAGPTRGPLFDDLAVRELHAWATALGVRPSFRMTLEAVQSFAEVCARKSPERSPSGAEQRRDAGLLALGLLLEPWCPACHGTRFEVVPGTNRQSQRACPACRGSGARGLSVRSQEVRWLVGNVLARLEHKAERVDRLLAKFLRYYR